MCELNAKIVEIKLSQSIENTIWVTIFLVFMKVLA